MRPNLEPRGFLNPVVFQDTPNRYGPMGLEWLLAAQVLAGTRFHLSRHAAVATSGDRQPFDHTLALMPSHNRGSG